MFKLRLIKNNDIIFAKKNSDMYTSKTVIGRIEKTCIICGKHIRPKEISTTHTRIHKHENIRKYITYHTCNGRCSKIFLKQSFKL